jgi:hypothetical protein
VEPPKLARVFDREGELQGLAAFAADLTLHATLRVLSGRRRQGKNYLLQALARSTGGLYFEATEGSRCGFSAGALVRCTREPLDQPFRDMNDAIRPLLLQFSGEPTLVVFDEFPFLSQVSPALPSFLSGEVRRLVQD